MITADRTTEGGGDNSKEDKKNYAAMSYIQSKVDKKKNKINKSPSKSFTGFEINKGANKKNTMKEMKNR
jgi:hypothetical protein